MFYGFAENKETEINQDKNVLIKNIYTTPGAAVNKGDLLIDVSHSNIEEKDSRIGFDVQKSNILLENQLAELEIELHNLKEKHQTQIQNIDFQIQDLRQKMSNQNQLLEAIESIKIPKTVGENPAYAKIAQLEKQKVNLATLFELEKKKKEASMASNRRLLSNQVQQLDAEKAFLDTLKSSLSIFAPSDGLIGNIHCKEGEHISSFRTLISFYERNPTLVKGYVHENLLLEVAVGDSLDVKSTLHAERNSKGLVVGLGTRIVEIPERLRKIPEIKTYGREVLIQIPANNSFLQKEKVMLNFQGKDDLTDQGFFTFLKDFQGK